MVELVIILPDIRKCRITVDHWSRSMLQSRLVLYYSDCEQLAAID